MFFSAVIFREKNRSSLELNDEMMTDDCEAKKPTREEKIGELGILILQDSVRRFYLNVASCSEASMLKLPQLSWPRQFAHHSNCGYMQLLFQMIASIYYPLTSLFSSFLIHPWLFYVNI